MTDKMRKYLISALVWDFTLRCVVISYRSFGTASQSRLHR